jgi:hypothetical protein
LTSLRLRFDATDIEHWANRYTYRGEYRVETEVGPRVRAQGYLTKADFLTLCHWKSPRATKLCSTNPEDFIKAATQTALSTAHERLRIEVLTLLRGVSWPTASVILHFGALEPYPILDYRALWSLGVEATSRYDFGFWWRYTLHCRELAERCSVSMRMLDRALWQFSKENQP